MKKIITASIVAIMAVTAANADIASTTYVTSRTGTVSFDSGAAKGKTNLTEAIKAVDAALGTTTGNAATKTELQNAQNALQANIDKKVATETYNAFVQSQSTKDSGQDGKISALEASLGEDGATAEAIAKAQSTADGAVSVNTTQGAAITNLQNDKLDKSTYNAFVQSQSTKDSGQDTKISALETSLGEGGATAKAIADAQSTADGAVTVNTAQGTAITNLQNAVNALDGTYATDAQAATAAKAATDALNANSVGAEGSFISTVSQTKGTIAAEKTAFVGEINEASENSTIAPQTKAVKAYVDTQFGVVNQANSSVAQKVGALEAAVTADGALIDQFADYKTENDGRVDALEGFKTGLGTAATVNATTNNVVTSVTTTNGKVTAVGSSQITNAMVAANAGIEKTKLASDVQNSLGKADTAMQQSALKGLASWTDQKCGTTGVTCSLVSKDGTIAWEAVKY